MGKHWCRILILFLSLSYFGVQAQDTLDSTLVDQNLQDTLIIAANEAIEVITDTLENRPNTAALYSAALPGLGQAYNKKYWKIPIVWGGFAAFGYFINWHNEQYQFYRRNLIYAIEGDPDYPNETNLDVATLRSGRDFYRRNRDQLALYGILFYLVQIVDAHVDAHLIEFDVNQDLSARIQPNFIPLQTGGGNLTLSIKFTF